jgi:hypothetical protein
MSCDKDSYSVVFKNYNGTILSIQNVEEGSNAIAPVEPIREGYIFTGWDISFDNVTSNLEIKAQYEIKKYTVKFFVDGVQIGEDQQVEHGKNAVLPENPAKDGYIFTGWNKSHTNIVSDLELDAIFDINVYRVTFIDYNSYIIKEVFVEHGTDAVAPDNPTREGHDFIGWDKEYKNVTTNLEVKAQYELKTYTIKFLDANGVLIPGTEQEVEHGKDAVLPETNPSKPGHTFSGWLGAYTNVVASANIEPAFDINVYKVTFKSHEGFIIKEIYVNHGGSVKTEDVPEVPNRYGWDSIAWNETDYTNITDNIEINAQYQIKEYEINFSVDGIVVNTQMINHGALAIMPEDPVKDGYTFIGWFFGESINDNQFTNQTVVTSSFGLIARFEKNNYLVRFLDYDESLIYAEYVLYDASANKPINPEREGYTFIGWDKEFLEVKSDLIINAQYRINQYTIKFNSDGGTTFDDVTKDFNTIITLTVPTKLNYVFRGWSDGVDIYEGNYTIKKSLTLTAIWIDAVNYQITFDTVDGDPIAPMSVLTYDYVNELPVATKTDVVFTGWSYLGNPISVPFRYTFEKDITLVANWKGLSAGVEYIIENDEAIITKYVGSEEELILPDTILGKNITTIQSQAFKDNQTLRSIKLGKHITTVGDEAFMNMLNLENVEFHNNTKNFGFSVFKDSNKIKNITLSSEIPNELRYYFGNNINFIPNSLETITYAIGGTIIDKTLTQGNMRNVGLVLASDTTTIESNQFENASSLTSITIPNGVTKLGNYSFKRCESLKNIVFEVNSQLNYIGYESFANCRSLKHIKIPNKVTYMGDRSFYLCLNLTNIEFENNSKLSTIGSGAFQECRSLNSIIIPISVMNMGREVFNSSYFVENIKTVIYAETISQPTGWDSHWNYHFPVVWNYKETIEDNFIKYALSKNGNAHVIGLVDNEQISDVVIPKQINGYTIDTISMRAFMESNIESIYISNNVKNIEYLAFYKCSNLTQISFESNSQLENIGHVAFARCINLTSISIPSGVRNLSGTFSGCTNLTNVVFEQNSQLESIGQFTFEGAINLTHIVIPESVTKITSAFDNTPKLTIYTEVSSKPVLWNNDWNSSRPVYWKGFWHFDENGNPTPN